MRFRPHALSFFTVALTASSVFAHFDVTPRIDAGKLVTGGHDDSSGEDQSIVRVFGFDFGEDALDPFYANDPGFNTNGAHSLTPGAGLRFDITTPLYYWNGAGTPSLNAPTAGETLTLSLGGSVTVNGSSPNTPAFQIQVVDPAGNVHRHLNARLNGSGGDPTHGAYIFGATISQTGSNPLTSDPFYIVFNNALDPTNEGHSEQLHDEIISYVQNTLVPEPATLMAALPTIGLLRRRR